MKETVTNVRQVGNHIFMEVTEYDELSKELGLEHNVTMYNIDNKRAVGILMAWNGDEPFESWTFETDSDQKDYMNGYNWCLEHKVA